MSALAKLKALSARDRVLLVRAAALQAFVVPAVAATGYGKVRAALGRLCPLSKTPPRGAAAARARQVALVVNAAARRSWPRARCLERSLVLWALLRREGIEGRIRFGVKPGAAIPDAHAWVEVSGEPVNDSPDVATRYASLEPPR